MKRKKKNIPATNKLTCCDTECANLNNWPDKWQPRPHNYFEWNISYWHRVRNAQCFSGNEITYFKLQYISHTTPKSFELKVVNEERARCLSVCLSVLLSPFLVSKTVSYTVYTHSHIWDKVLQSIIQSGLTPNLGERSWSCNLRCLHRRRYSETN